MAQIKYYIYKTYSVLLLIIASLSVFAQKEGDSILQSINSSVGYPAKIKAYLYFGEKAGAQNFDMVISVAQQGLKLARVKGDSLSAGTLLRQIGQAYYFKGDFDAAAKYFYESVRLFEATNEKASLANSYNSLAKLYRKTRDLSRSLENYDKAMALFGSAGDSSGMAMIYNESGVVYEYAFDYEKAAARYTRSLKINEKLNDQVGISYALSNLAGLYTLQKKYVQAEKYLLRSLQVRKELKDNFQLALNYSDLGSNYLSAESFAKARAYLDTSNGIADKLGYPEVKSTNYEMLAAISEKENDPQAALNFYKLKTALHDSLFTLEKTKQIEELNTRYDTEKKESKIKEQQAQIALRNYLMIAAIVLAILGVLLVYAQYRRVQWRQQAKMQSDIVKEREHAAMAVLVAEDAERSRIASDLHDGVGQLMSAVKMNLSALEHRNIFQNDNDKRSFEKIISLVDAGCNEVRSVSHNIMPNALLQNNIITALQEFINKLDQSVLKVHLHSEGFTDVLNGNIQNVLYRIIQECVNNVIKHSGADTLDISLIKEPDMLSVSIEDNGKGFDINHKPTTGGIGLKNIHTRIQYLKGTVEFASKPGKGTLVALHIPV